MQTFVAAILSPLARHQCQTVRVHANPEVDAYLQAVPEGRREALAAIRDACRAGLPDFTEVMRYGMPGYVRVGAEDVEVGFAQQKNYFVLYILRTDVMARHRDRLSGLSVGKGAIRYRRPEQLDLDVVHLMLRDTAGSAGPVC